MEAMTAGACFGDDVGDLPAFAALGELGQAGVSVARVAVVHGETPPEVSAAADLTVEGQEGALALLALLAAA
jgi:trehalose 6-phosphate phosphatase